MYNPFCFPQRGNGFRFFRRSSNRLLYARNRFIVNGYYRILSPNIIIIMHVHEYTRVSRRREKEEIVKNRRKKTRLIVFLDRKMVTKKTCSVKIKRQNLMETVRCQNARIIVCKRSPTNNKRSFHRIKITIFDTISCTMIFIGVPYRRRSDRSRPYIVLCVLYT